MAKTKRKPGQIPPQESDRARARKRAGQLAAASQWQAKIRERRALEETFLKFNGTEVVNPRVGRNGRREPIPSMVLCGDELLDAIEAEETARQAYVEAGE